MNTIEIRLAKKEDAQFIALLGRITFTETFGHFFRDQKDLIDYYNLTFSVQKIEDGIKKPNNIFWIAFVNRLPIGYAKLKLYSNSEFIESKDVCQLQKIYVLKDFLSMKIGFGLQDLLLKKAKELNFNQVLKGDPLRFVYDKEIDPNTLKFLLEKMNINSDSMIVPIKPL